ncbi:cytochrome P450 [Polychytrium aggregatum]|uniref:cytochrome P450 n=1 Tax=Polychytrium aggregatum TaxID=110093 RepID=UPI0022FEBDAD|nr:cytochrome P450 [Polychytrium aggregatum]KAI9206912.1 cytochrome P450 [Polychytrium aggregatum]
MSTTLTTEPLIQSGLAFARQYGTQLAIAGTVLLASGAYAIFESASSGKSIPGPKSWPFIGEFLTIGKYIADRRVHMFFHDIQEKYGPIGTVHILGRTSVLISDADEIKRVLKGDDKCEFIRSEEFQLTHKGIAHYALFLIPTGDVWKRHRKFLQPGFGPVQLRAAAEASNQYMDLMITKLGASSKINMHLVANAVVLDIIGAIAFSKDLGTTALLDRPAELDEAFSPFKNIAQITSNRFGLNEWLWDRFGVGMKIGIDESRAIKEITRKTLAERRALSTPHPNEDLMDRLLFVDTSGDAKFTEEEILDEIYGFFLAGHETTANLITFVMIELMKHPDVYEKAQQEVDSILGRDGLPAHEQLSQFKYIDMVIKETLRMYPPVPLLARRTTKDTQILGYHVKSGIEINVVISHLHRNPKYWENPEEFNPDRWIKPHYPGSYLPFGDGPMNCIGQKMANIETRIFVIRALQRYNFKLLDPSQLRIVFSITQGYKDGVDVLVEQRA